MNSKQMADAVLLAVKSFVDGAISGFANRIDAIESRMANIKDGRDGTDGKSVSVEDVAPMLKELVAMIPPAKDGRDGKDGESIKGDKGEPGTDGKDGQNGINGKDGTNGLNGKDADEEAIFQRVLASVGPMIQKAVADIPRPADGRDGKDADPEHIKSLVNDAVSAIPKPENGRDGKDGESVHPDTVLRMVNETVAKAVELIPKPIDGKDGKDADPEVIKSMVRQAVESIPAPKDGQDGKSITVDDVRPVLESELSKWELDFERRSQSVLQRAIDKMPVPADGKDGQNGANGKDAFSLSDLSAELKEDGRTVVFKFSDGENVQAHEIRFDVPVYRGVFKPESAYQKSDTVTYGGSLWIAQKDAPGRPGDSDSWKLSVKKGADAK